MAQTAVALAATLMMLVSSINPVMGDVARFALTPMSVVQANGEEQEFTVDEKVAMAPAGFLGERKLYEEGVKYAESVKVWNVTVDTVNGKVTLPDYEGVFHVKKDETAKSFLSDKPHVVISNMPDHIEVSLDNQEVYVVKGGEVVYSTSCVTGQPKHPTDPGIFKIDFMQRNATLKGFNDDGSKYESKVAYWMPFNGGQGLHDASWRGEFGGDIHSYSGSHGCVNLPVGAAETIWGYAEDGMPVVVY